MAAVLRRAFTSAAVGAALKPAVAARPLCALLRRLTPMLGARLDGACEAQLLAAPLHFELRTADIASLEARVKHLSALDYAEGALLSLQVLTY